MGRRRWQAGRRLWYGARVDRLAKAGRGAEAEADAGQVVGQGVVDDAGEPMLEPGQGVGMAGLDGEAAVAEAEGLGGAQPLVEGGRIHPQREGVQNGLPGNLT